MTSNQFPYFRRPDYYQTPTLLTLAVEENHSLVIPSNEDVFLVVASLCLTGNTSAFRVRKKVTALFTKQTDWIERRSIEQYKQRRKRKIRSFWAIYLNRQNIFLITFGMFMWEPGLNKSETFLSTRCTSLLSATTEIRLRSQAISCCA